MRVLIWGANPLSRDSAYWFWLKTGMEAIGHQVIALDALPLAGLFGIAGMQQILLAAAKAYRVQAALVLPQNFVEPSFLEALKDMGVAVVSFRYDDCLAASPGGAGMPPPHWRFFTQLNPYCDVNATVSRHIGPILAAQGLPPPDYVPFPWGWQAVPAAELPLRPVIAFCGSPKQQDGCPESWRVQVVKALHAAGLPLELHHSGWLAFPDLAAVARPTPSLGDFYRVIRSSTVNLSLASDWLPHPYRGIKGLNLEIGSAGGPQLSSPSDELDDLFEVGRDILTAETPADFVAVARQMLDQPDMARSLGRHSRQAMMRHGGWDVWWQRVAGLLEAVGKPLDLDGEAVQPDPTDTAWLATALTAVAHAYEMRGNQSLAAVYFGMVLAWRPDDYAAHAGLARLQDRPAEALPLWRRAAALVAPTAPIMLPCPLGMPGVGALGTTQYQYEAATHWLVTALETGQLEGVLDALDICVPYDHHLAVAVADRLFLQGDGLLALQALDTGLRHWPESGELQDLRRHLMQTLAARAIR